MLQEIVRELLTSYVVSCNAAISTCKKSEQWDGVLGMRPTMVH